MAKFIVVTRKIGDDFQRQIVNIDTIYRTNIMAGGLTVIEQTGSWDSGATIYRDSIGSIIETPEEIYALIQEAQAEQAEQTTRMVLVEEAREEEGGPVDLSGMSEEDKAEALGL